MLILGPKILGNLQLTGRIFNEDLLLDCFVEDGLEIGSRLLYPILRIPLRKLVTCVCNSNFSIDSIDDGLVLSHRLIARANNESQLVSEFARALKRKLEGSRGVQLNLPLERKQVVRAKSILEDFRSGNDLKVERFR